MLKHSRLYWRARWTLRRWRAALAYATGRLDANTARDIVYDCETASQCYAIVSVSAHDLVHYFTDADGIGRPVRPEVRALIEEATAYVASKYESLDSERDVFREWVWATVIKYADERGIALTPLTEPGADDELVGVPA